MNLANTAALGPGDLYTSCPQKANLRDAEGQGGWSFASITRHNFEEPKKARKNLPAYSHPSAAGYIT